MNGRRLLLQRKMMNSITTNFFEIFINPEIRTLYVTDRLRKDAINATDNVVANFTKTSVISLYPFEKNFEKVPPKPEYVEWLVKQLLFSAFEQSKSFFDIDYKRGEVTILDENLLQKEEYSILRRLVVRVFYARERLFLALDPITKLYNRLSLSKLLNRYGFSPNDFIEHNNCLVFVEKHQERRWARGFIRDIPSSDHAKVEVPYLFDGTIEVSTNRVIPTLNKGSLSAIAKRSNRQSDFDRENKKVSDFTSKGKLGAILALFGTYIQPIFPILIRKTAFNISSKPISADIFPCGRIPSQSESEYVIERAGPIRLKDKRRLAGLSHVNVTAKAEERKVVLFGTVESVGILRNIVNQLNNGISRDNYRFSLPEQFGVTLSVSDEFVVNRVNDYMGATDRLLLSGEERHSNVLSLIYLPPFSDLYYPLKAKFAHFGKVSQVISRSSYDIYATWNLATNIYAKLGYQPWGITESPDQPNADIVLGLAYSSLRREGRLRRNIGYVNVFDKHGVWRFMQSSSDYLDFDNRIRLIPQLIRNAIVGFMAGGTSPKIIDIHYTKRFSLEERRRTFDVVTKEVPEIEEVNFISIDKTHPLRVFDRVNSNLNFDRGRFLELNPNEFLLSVAGEGKPNALASRLLKVRVWREPYTSHGLDLFPIAYRILAMTKLNWRSAVRETSEPVTLKYAEEIARLTNHFSLTEWNTVNNMLSRIPWFI